MKNSLQNINKLLKSVFLTVLIMVCCASTSKTIAPDPNNESTIKALFVYNFTKQIEWPAESLNKSQFTICVYGDDEIAEKLIEVVKGRKFLDKNIEVKIINKISDSNGSQILFIPRSKTAKTENEMLSIAPNSILIITEEKKMPQNYSCINLLEKNEQMRFEINQASLKKQNLKVSNTLLKLAINI